MVLAAPSRKTLNRGRARTIGDTVPEGASSRWSIEMSWPLAASPATTASR
jgi:hypothetical protein